MIKNLDINTPKGQISRNDELRAIALFKEEYPHISILEPKKSTEATMDWILAHGSMIIGGAEVKCRYDIPDLNFFKTKYNNEWLVTNNKIEECSSICAHFVVPFFGILFLPPSGIMLVKTIWSPEKGNHDDFRVEYTETKATTNGGKIWRENAYIPMHDAKVFVE